MAKKKRKKKDEYDVKEALADVRVSLEDDSKGDHEAVEGLLEVLEHMHGVEHHEEPEPEEAP